jgi:hypothetical protein
MDNNPIYQKEEQQPKSTYCNGCGYFESEDGQYSEHFVPESIKRQYEIEEKDCKDCKLVNEAMKEYDFNKKVSKIIK